MTDKPKGQVMKILLLLALTITLSNSDLLAQTARKPETARVKKQ
jgi:hypothetical protein